MAVGRTLILAEPDAVARGLSGESVARFERRGFVLGAPLLRVDGALAEQHPAEHTDRGSCALAMPGNLVRGSDSPGSAEREIAVWFADVLV
jgi:nucleoside diphosphate kinase